MCKSDISNCCFAWGFSICSTPILHCPPCRLEAGWLLTLWSLVDGDQPSAMTAHKSSSARDWWTGKNTLNSIWDTLNREWSLLWYLLMFTYHVIIIIIENPNFLSLNIMSKQEKANLPVWRIVSFRRNIFFSLLLAVLKDFIFNTNEKEKQ